MGKTDRRIFAGKRGLVRTKLSGLSRPACSALRSAIGGRHTRPSRRLCPTKSSCWAVCARAGWWHELADSDFRSRWQPSQPSRAALALWAISSTTARAEAPCFHLAILGKLAAGLSEKRRLSLREPWAFLAQVLFLLAIIAALWESPHWQRCPRKPKRGNRDRPSAWSQMQPKGGASWLQEIRTQAINFLGSVPSGDRVVLLRADADGAPILPFTTDRDSLRRSIADLQSSSALPDVPRALSQGLAALGDSSRGLLVYVGPGIIDDEIIRGAQPIS